MSDSICIMSFTVLMIFLIVTLTMARPPRSRENFENAIDDLAVHLRHIENVMHGFPDNQTGSKVSAWNESMGINPEEMGSYVEGDILFPSAVARNGLITSSARWPSGIVPYMISPYFSAQQRKLIYEAMNDYHKYTCIRFKPYRGEENDYIRITAGNSGCWSSVGRIGGWQDVNLQVPGCLAKKGTVIHELMHAIGFLHEQSRYERDNFVAIQWNNILNGNDRNFKKASKETTNDFGIGYDYGSVMHYSSYAFSKNGQPTIIPKKPIGIFTVADGFFQGDTRGKLGQREGFSKRDIQKIRRMYRCNQGL